MLVNDFAFVAKFYTEWNILVTETSKQIFFLSVISITSHSLAKLCGERPPDDVTSVSNIVMMKFVSDGDRQGVGFNGTYSWHLPIGMSIFFITFIGTYQSVHQFYFTVFIGSYQSVNKFIWGIN